MSGKKKPEKLNDNIVQNIVCNLKELSFIVWLLSVSKNPDNIVKTTLTETPTETPTESPTETPTEPNKKQHLKIIYIIKLAIRLVLLLLTKNNENPIKIKDNQEESASINDKIKQIREHEIFKNRIRPFLITITANDGAFNTFLENLFYELQDIMYFFKIYEKNKDEGGIEPCDENQTISPCWTSSTKYTIRLIVFTCICTFSFLTGVFNAPLINYFIRMGKFVAYNIFKVQNLIPSFLSIDTIVGSFNGAKDEYSPEIKHIYKLLLESQIIKNIYKFTTYETENRHLLLREIVNDSVIFLNPTESAWNLTKEKIKQKQEKIFSSISKDSESVLKPIPEDGDSILTLVDTGEVSQEGGNKSIYTDMIYMTSTNNKSKYNILNNFIDTNSLQGIYMLHKYNKFLE